MRRISSRRFSVHVLPMLAPLLLASLAIHALAIHAQSLGDVARENRDKKAADGSATPPRVITNANLPKDPDADAESNTEEGQAQSTQSPANANAEASRKAAAQRAAEQRAAQQWKRKILAQENAIANLRMRVDRLKASIHFVDQNTGYDYSTGVAVNRYQARQLERLAQLQQQLSDRKKRLEDMQEAARHAGMHTAVYDP